MLGAQSLRRWEVHVIQMLLSDPGPLRIYAPFDIPECWIPSGARLAADPRLPELISVHHWVRRDRLAEIIRLVSSGGVAVPPPRSQPPASLLRPDRRDRSHLVLIP